jgi:hypothetical protein
VADIKEAAMTPARPCASPTVSIPLTGGGTGVVIAGVTRVFIIEQSNGDQFHRYLRAEHSIDAEIRSLPRPGPLSLRPGEILQELMRWSRP